LARTFNSGEGTCGQRGKKAQRPEGTSASHECNGQGISDKRGRQTSAVVDIQACDKRSRESNVRRSPAPARGSKKGKKYTELLEKNENANHFRNDPDGSLSLSFLISRKEEAWKARWGKDRKIRVFCSPSKRVSHSRKKKRKVLVDESGEGG